jgi:hypothetical protein
MAPEPFAPAATVAPVDDAVEFATRSAPGSPQVEEPCIDARGGRARRPATPAGEAPL